MPKKYTFSLITLLILIITFLGFIFIKPYIVDKVLDLEGRDLGFNGVYDNPLIYVIILFGFITSFINIIFIVTLVIKKSLNNYKKWVISSLLSILLFVVIFAYHHFIVRYTTLTPAYKQTIQERLGVWNQKVK